VKRQTTAPANARHAHSETPGTKSIRLLYVAPANSVHSFKWVEFFRAQGCDVTWYSFHPVSEAQQANYPMLRPRHLSFGPLAPLSLVIGWLYLFFAARRLRPQILHAHSVGRYGIAAAFLFLRPFVATAWGSDILVSGKSRWMGPFVRFALRRADLITCDADHMIAEMSAMGVDSSKMLRINFGVDTDALTRLDSPDPGYAARFRQGRDVLTVISLRNHSGVYDIATLVRAVPLIRDRVANVRVIIAGRGPLTDSLKALACELGVADSVEFIGGYDGSALRRMFSACDVYVSTSLSDAGIAASTAEAMACCVPVVISDTGENEKWIQAGVNGCLFRAKDHEGLAAKVVSLLEDGELRARIGSSGRETTVARNSYRGEMTRMLEAYRDLLAQVSGGAAGR